MLKNVVLIFFMSISFHVVNTNSFYIYSNLFNLPRNYITL